MVTIDASVLVAADGNDETARDDSRELLRAVLRAHLEDAFLVRTIALHTASERQRMVNPRKAYPVDQGLITLYERTGREQRGRALETAVLLELVRRGYAVSYIRTADGWEVDFMAERVGGTPILVQVSQETNDESTREVRALASARGAIPWARAVLVTLDGSPPARALPDGLSWAPAAKWLVEAESAFMA